MIVIDRIEGEIAVLEIAGATYEIPTSALPEGAAEGAVLRLELDPQSQAEILDEANARHERLKKRGPRPGGTLVL
jgi:hypothetical protein